MLRIAAAAIVVIAAAKRAPATIDDIIESPMPSIFNLPTPEVTYESTSGAEVPKRGRRLQKKEDGTFPNYVSVGAFDGLASTGFVTLKYNVLMLNTTVNLEEYMDVFTMPGVTTTCEVRGEEPYLDDDYVLHKGQVSFSVAIPSTGASVLDESLLHFRQRIVPGNVVVFPVHLMAALPSFRRGGPCATAIPATSPYYRIVVAGEDPSSTASTLVLTLGLAPVDMAALWGWSNIEFEWDPQPEREVTRRRSLGIALPEDIDQQVVGWHENRRRLSASYGRELPMNLEWSQDLFNINYDSTAKAARVAKYNIIPDNILYCEGCYAYFKVKLVVKIQACIKLPGAAYSYWFDINSPDFTSKETYNYGTALGTSGEPDAKFPTPPPDCKALGTTKTATPADPSLFNIALKVDVDVTGDAGFNFKIKSDGINKVTTTCPAGKAWRDPACDMKLIEPTTLSPITISVGGLPVSITPTVEMTGAGEAKVVMEGKFQAGAYFEAGAEAHASLLMPGTSTAELQATTATLSTKFYADWGTHPFILTGFNSASGGFNAKLTPRLVLSVYDAVPIYVNAPTNAALNIAMGTSRLRNLASVSSECSTVGGSYDSKYDANALVGIEKVTLKKFVNGIVGYDTTSPKIAKATIDKFWAASSESFANTEVFPAKYEFVKIADETKLAGGCTKAGSGPVASAAPSTLPAGFAPIRLKTTLTLSGLPSISSAVADAVMLVMRKLIASALGVEASKVSVLLPATTRLLSAQEDSLSPEARALAQVSLSTLEVSISAGTEAEATAYNSALSAATGGSTVLTSALYRVAIACGVSPSAVSMRASAGTVVPMRAATPEDLKEVAAAGAAVPGPSSGTTGASSSSGPGAGAIVGIIIGVLLIVAVVGVMGAVGQYHVKQNANAKLTGAPVLTPVQNAADFYRDTVQKTTAYVASFRKPATPTVAVTPVAIVSNPASGVEPVPVAKADASVPVPALAK